MIATSANPTVYVLLFSFSIVLTYLTVRRGWLHLPAATISGVIYTSVSFFLYSLARGNNLIHALSVGIGLGTVFTLAAVVIAAGFRANAFESSGREIRQTATPVLSIAEDETALKV